MQLKKLFVVALLLSIGSITWYACTSNQAKTPSGIDLTWMDSTVKPQSDFYEWAAGGWLKKTPIPSTNVSWGVSDILYEKSLTDMRYILDSVTKITDAPKGSVTQLVSDLYSSGMDSVTRNQNGAAPLKPYIDKIDGITDLKALSGVCGDEQLQGPSPFFGVGIGADLKNSNRYIVSLGQGGIGLPDRDYYFLKDPHFAAIREGYVIHIAKMFELLGDDSVKAKLEARTVMNIETQLAGFSSTNTELRDTYANYHKISYDELKKMTPSFDWDAFVKPFDAPTIDSVVVGQPKFFTGLNSFLAKTPIADLKTYMRWQYITSEAAYLSDNFRAENFAFYGKELNGQPQMRPRWKSVSSIIDGQIGDAMGQLYVAKYFPPASKQKMLDLVNNLITAYTARIQSAEWMDASTKTKALDKLDKVVKKIGYPDKWRDYSTLDISKQAYVLNVINANAFNTLYQAHRLGQPMDRTQWGMTAATVNAQYDPDFNDITFPAAILQPPFFDPNADDAVNYGRIGAVIGHEMTHGFDDQGSKYDASGNLSTWWTAKDSIEYSKRTGKIVNQFNHYKVLDTIPVNGQLTLGENIADLGGINIAYDAFKMTDEGKDTSLRIQGYSPDQRFFIGWAQLWAENDRPDYAIELIHDDVHSPTHFRADGPISNMPQFYAAFDVKPGDAMYREDSVRTKIW
jgi:putative endopeptidase